MCGVVGHPLAMTIQQQQQQQQQDCDVHGPRKPAVAPLEASPASNIHVLVVDDERLTRVVLSGLLMKCGYRVTSASDGAEALRLLRSSAPNTFQLVLTDVCMPEVNGIELLSQVKADANLRAVPVVMMSSVDQEETVAECVQYGAEEYLVKPVTKKEVQHIWQHVWRKRCAGATVPQLPPEAAAAMAAVAAAAATQQTHSEQAQQPSLLVQDVQQPAEPSSQQAQQVESGINVEQLILNSTAASLQERQRVFTAAVDMVQASHLEKQPLLCLRPSRLQLAQHGLAVRQEGGASSSSGGSQVDALYCSPEEAAGQPGCPSDMFSLGLLFLDLFFPCSSQEHRLEQLRAARCGVLPAVLSGAHTAGAAQALQDLVRGLLQADPAGRPSVHSVLRAGLADSFRQVEQLPHWRLAPTQQPAQQAAAEQQQPVAPQEQQVHTEAAAAPAPQPALGGAVVAVDHDAVRHFLLLLRKSKQQEVAAAQAQLAALEADIGETARRRAGSDVASSCPAGGTATAEPPAKRQRCGSGPGNLGVEVAAEARQRLAAALPRLEEVYFQRRNAVQAAVQQHAQSAGPVDAPAAAEACGSGKADEGAHLEPFAADLQRLAARSRLGLKAALRCGDIASPTEMACCAAFDRDDEFFATVGVSRRVKIFDFRACLEGRRGGALHYPALQITTRSKLSSVSWNHYVKSQLITSDYGGLIQLWDASTAGEAAQFDEHARRVWSVDFSTTDPMRFLSGSDDGSVRLWSVHDSGSVARIQAPANVCSVQFSPADAHTVAFGCANYRVYLYDLRHTAAPLAVASGPQRAVSYVRFLGGSHLVSASTDSTLRLWDLRDLLTSGSVAAPSLSDATADSLSARTNESGGAAPGTGRTQPVCTYTGHRNQRNFVGLSVAPSGHILCGSEDNAVYSYYRSLPFPTASYQFPDAAISGGPAAGSGGPAAGSSASGGAHQPFVSAVCWANNSRHCLAANSQGLLQILELE